MKKLIILLLLIALPLPQLLFSQVEVKEFDMVYLKAKKEKITDVKSTYTEVTIYDKSITVKYLGGMFVFEIIAEIPNEKGVTKLLVASPKQGDIKVAFDDNNTAIIFEYNDRVIMFYNLNKIGDYIKTHEKGKL